LASTSIAILARRQGALVTVADRAATPGLASTVPLSAAAVLPDPLALPARASAAGVPVVHDIRGGALQEPAVVAELHPRLGRR